MSYRDGEALNWHFDRSEFTTTLLLQEPLEGGKFQYRSNLRTAENPNYEGIAAVLDGRDPDVKTLTLEAGTLNVFRGVNALHRVTPVQGSKERMIAIFSYYENTGVMFSDEESIGFYGRAS
jgi:predicted 2-oxoglutarate/Fe(II)-dependent dioxygenase YbiX